MRFAWAYFRLGLRIERAGMMLRRNLSPAIRLFVFIGGSGPDRGFRITYARTVISISMVFHDDRKFETFQFGSAKPPQTKAWRLS